ncbi:MAG: hypothetical protein NHG36_00910 [Chromatiaceae bacterium]|jgi:hypothetical protein|nr:hypothetical protein [Candidatus Thioaporhodococcus sediminis]
MTTVTTSPPLVWAVGGSRSLSPAGQELAATITSYLLAPGSRIAVGCSKGADAAVIRAALGLGLASQLHILCAFGPISRRAGAFAVPGAGSTSDPYTVDRAARAGARVKPWAGGGVNLVFPQRLSNRSRAVALAATWAGVLVCEQTWGTGSCVLMRALASRGLPILALPVPHTLSVAPPVAGAWSRVAPACLGGLPAWYLPGQVGRLYAPLAA